MSDASVRVLRILGREYNIKAPAGEERVLQEAAAPPAGAGFVLPTGQADGN